MNDWRAHIPQPEDVPSLQVLRDAGFPDRLALTSADEVRSTVTYLAADGWWRAMDVHLAQGPRGLAIWEDGVIAGKVLALLAKRIMCWRDLPLPAKGVRVLPVMYIESRDLYDDARFESAKDVGTLVVGGVGALKYGTDRAVEVLCELAQIRERAGLLTLWHLAPSPTRRSERVCDDLVQYLGDRVVTIGRRGGAHVR